MATGSGASAGWSGDLASGAGGERPRARASDSPLAGGAGAAVNTTESRSHAGPASTTGTADSAGGFIGVRATMNALTGMPAPERIAAKRGKTIAEITG